MKIRLKHNNPIDIQLPCEDHSAYQAWLEDGDWMLEDLPFDKHLNNTKKSHMVEDTNFGWCQVLATEKKKTLTFHLMMVG